MSIWVWEPCLIRPEMGGLESPNMGKIGIPGRFREWQDGDISYYIEPQINLGAGKCCPDCGSIPGKATKHDDWLKGSKYV